jgi:hypothetical protein
MAVSAGVQRAGVQRVAPILIPISIRGLVMRLIVEALAKSFLASSGLELAVTVALLGLYMWLSACTPPVLRAIPIRIGVKVFRK